jgi:glycine cleavage system H protein
MAPPGEGGSFRLGITDYAQDQLGDIVFVELPEVGDVGRCRGPPRRGREHQVGGRGLRSRRRYGDGVNDAVAAQPELINSDPYGDGWLVEMEAHRPLPTFLDAAAYRTLTE